MSLSKDMRDLVNHVEAMPPAWQMNCAEILAMFVNEWQQRQEHPELSDDAWWDVRSQRLRERRERRREERERL